MISKSNLMLATLVCGVAIGSRLQALSARGEQPMPAPIPARDAEERGIAGHLGPPLGTVIRVEGTIMKGDPHYKATAYELYLQVDSVGGTKLIKPVVDRLSYESRHELKPGDRITCIGWEAGGCRGIVNDPEKLFDVKGMSIADVRYRFYTEFVVAEIKR